MPPSAQRTSGTLSSSARPTAAFVEGFAVEVDGVQHDSWTNDLDGPPESCPIHDRGGETVSIRSAHPAEVTFFYDPRSHVPAQGNTPVGLHLEIDRTYSPSERGGVACPPLPNPAETDCGHRARDVTVALAFDGRSVSLLGEPWGEEGAEPLLWSCQDGAAYGGPPLTTRDLQLQALSGGLRSSGVVAGPVLIGQLVDSNSDVIAATVTGKASRKWNPAAGVSRTTSVDLTVQGQAQEALPNPGRRPLHAEDVSGTRRCD